MTMGELNSAADNAIVLPTYYTGQHGHYQRIIGPDRALDPTRYFIIVPNMFGNGVSTSPSNDPLARTGQAYPRISIYDNVVQQAKLVFDHLAVSEVALVCGWSLGGMQAYQWAAMYPDRTRRLLAYCSAAKTSVYNAVFLDALKACIEADHRWRPGRCSARPDLGIRAFARVYAGWAYSHEFYRDGLYRMLGFATLEALLQSWEDEHLALDANDLLAMLETWRHANIAANAQFSGDSDRALRAIRARTILLPCSTDRYFPPVDNEEEARRIPDCELRILDSPYGHCALSPGRVESAMSFLDRCIREILSR